jgi:hypothetical protein
MITPRTIQDAKKIFTDTLELAGFSQSRRDPEWLDLLNADGHLNLRVVFEETQVELYKFSGNSTTLCLWNAVFNNAMPQAPVAELILASV